MNLLFVCNSNTNRSPTAKKTFDRLFKHIGLKHKIKSAGLSYGIPLTDKLLKWADLIFPMTMEEYVIISEELGVPDNRLHVIGIGDEYAFDDSKLTTLFMYWWYYKGQQLLDTR